jgi:hypothetical protein
MLILICKRGIDFFVDALAPEPLPRFTLSGPPRSADIVQQVVVEAEQFPPLSTLLVPQPKRRGDRSKQPSDPAARVRLVVRMPAGTMERNVMMDSVTRDPASRLGGP